MAQGKENWNEKERSQLIDSERERELKQDKKDQQGRQKSGQEGGQQGSHGQQK